MRVSVFDYGAGNLHSLRKALTTPGVEVVIEEDPVRATRADLLVLPGVGAFGAASERLAPGRAAMRDAILNGLPVIGICLGMQLLFDSSEEGAGSGLGVIAGRVSRLRTTRIPHIGWNTVEPSDASSVAVALPAMVYYANSFVCRPSSDSVVAAWTTHETDRFAAVVRAGTAVGVQFHPEKSSAAGVRFLHELLAAAPTWRSTT
jgi:imidazole glycerol-phosphate synthase subunit HisH